MDRFNFRFSAGAALLFYSLSFNAFFVSSGIHAEPSVLAGSGANATVKAESAVPQEKPQFAAAIDTHFSKSMAEDTSFQWHLEAKGGYRVWKSLHLIGQVEVKNLLSKYKERGEHWAFEDSLLGVSLNEIGTWDRYAIKMTPVLGIVLPTSRTSQDAGLRTGYFAGVTAATEWAGGKITYRNVLLFFDHQFKTSDPSGESANIYLADKNELEVTLKLLPKFELSGTGGLILNSSYRKSFFSVAVLELQPQYQLRKDLVVYTAATLKSRVVSDNSFLDDDNFLVELGVQWAL